MASEFRDVADSMLGDAENWCRIMFPAGRVRGSEFRVGSLDGEKGESLCVWMDKGNWKDFATGQTGGDLISLWAARYGISQGEALSQVSGRPQQPQVYIGSPRNARSDEPKPAPVSLVPDMRHPHHGKPSQVWDYISAEGEVLGYVCRYDPPNRRKQFCPWTLHDGKWLPQGFSAPKPLYGAFDLAARPDAPVLVCEGEKAADAARTASPEHVCITWPGGATAALHADWSALAGREVLLWPDADKAGIDCMNRLAPKLAELGCTVRLIDTIGQPEKWDAADAQFTPSQFRKWVESRIREAFPASTPALRTVDLDDLEHAEVLPPPMVVDPIIPKHQVTLLSGHGGSGKSQLILAICAHIAAGRAWGGFSSVTGRALYVSLEDPADLVRFRLKRICAVYGLPVRDVLGNLVVVDGTDSDSTLAVEQNISGVRSLVFTRTMEELERAAKDCVLVAIDNASDAYGGDETIRRQVRAFVAGLARMARRVDCGVVLLAHIDKNSAKNGSQGESYSGSTGWHNSVRSRLAITIAKESNVTMLEHEKANLGEKAKPVPLEFESGVIVPVTRSQTVEFIQRNNDDDVLVAAFEAAHRAGITVPAATSGPSQWHHALSGMPEFRLFENDSKRRRNALNRLLRDGVLVEIDYQKADRKVARALQLCGNSCGSSSTDCGNSP